MKWLTRLFGDPPSDTKPLRPPADRLYIVDATGLVDPRNKSETGQPHPRDHVAILKALSQFASREEITLQAVFMGRPLREAAEGELFNGVRVSYTDTGDALRRKILELARDQAGAKDVMVLTSDLQTEREAMAAGATCMRLSTFRKALDEREGGGERGGERGDRGGNGERGGERGDRGGSERGNERNQRSDRPAGEPAPTRNRGELPPQPQPQRQPQRQPQPQQQPQSQQPPGRGDDEPPAKDPSVLDLIDPL